jgi:glycosyltransferase involved in cell wall biosynthesis
VACYTSRMQALAVVSGDFVRTGGMDMANFALARRSAERGVPTHLVAHRVLDELAEQAGVVWHRVPRPFDSHLCGSPLLDRAGRRVARLVRGLSGRSVVNGGNCQVHDVNWVHYVHAAFRPAAQGTFTRRMRAAFERPIELARERAALCRAELVIANSERTRRELEQLLGIAPARIRTVYYGIDPTRFAPADTALRARSRAALGLGSAPQLVFVGGLGDRRKGFDTLYAAWARLCARASWDCELIVVGRGADLRVWRARAKSDGLAGRVRFLGFRSDVPSILAACDALVAPTRYEAYGLGVQEALCCGLPAIVSADSGVAERFVPELSPLLLQDPNSAEELVRRLESWRENIGAFRRHALALSATLRQRTWDTMADEIMSLLA